ncbi:Nmral1 [Symbiodinium natans]|uniref:Nmral1 protein n=1 Tax=Symbiodinium natans TaxID=878477 RepID=A0A812PY75_9DINO|nr:Nmral1 [Symbiodinium natans]
MPARRAASSSCQSVVAVVLGVTFVAVPGLYFEFYLTGGYKVGPGTPQGHEVIQEAAKQVDLATSKVKLGHPPAPPPSPPVQAKEPVPEAPAIDSYVVQSQEVEAEPPVLKASEEPAPAAPGAYIEQIFAKNRECADQAMELGNLPTVQACDEVAATKLECGRYFMFSHAHPDWICRCCSLHGEEEGPASDQWNVYKAQVPRISGLPPEPPTAPPVDPFAGLPIAPGPRPQWLARKDALVIDARPEEHGGIVILQAVLSDSHSTWGNSKDAQRLEDRPDWLRAILATNRAHAKKHGHAMVLRAHPTEPQLTDWMIKDCGKKSLRVCAKVNERETYNWEKHLMMQDYLLSPQAFTHVLMLDADAALIQPQLDTLQRIAAILDKKGKDLFLTNEDWLDQNGEARINGGLMLAKNTQFTQNLFQDTFDAHVAGYNLLKKARIGTPVIRCTSNEQICLNDLYYGDTEHFTSKVIMASGKKYNRGAERGGEAHITDETTEIMQLDFP